MTKKYVIRLLNEELYSVLLMSITFLAFAVLAGGMGNVGTFFASAGVFFFGTWAYTLFRKNVPPRLVYGIHGSFKKLEKEVLLLNAMRLFFFTKCAAASVLFVVLGKNDWILFPVNFFPVLVGSLFILVFREEVADLFGFNKVKMLMLTCQGYIFNLINRIENGKVAFLCGSLGMIVYCYIAKGTANYPELFFGGMIIAAITAYLYNTFVGDGSEYDNYNGYKYRHLNYQGRTCAYSNGKRYEAVPQEESCDYIDRYGYKRDSNYFPRRAV